MTNQEILTKAVEKAIANGWEFDNFDKWEWSAIKKTDTVVNNWYYFLLIYGGKEKFIDIERIIFDQDFARALWGERTTIDAYEAQKQGKLSEYIQASPGLFTVTDKWGWQEHLQALVLAADRIEYLRENI